MKYYVNKSIPARLNQAEEMLGIASTDPEISEELARYGLEASRFEEGRAYLAEASARETDQRTLLGAQVASTKIMEKNFQRFSKKFVTDRRMVQTVVPSDDPLFVELRLHLKTEASREGLLRQAIHFYQEVGAHEAVGALLNTEYGLSASAFDVRRDELSALLQFMQKQQLLIGQARVATRLRKEAMEELDAWMGEFISIARVAFKGNQQQLTKLGVAVRTGRRVEEEEERRSQRKERIRLKSRPLGRRP